MAKRNKKHNVTNAILKILQEAYDLDQDAIQQLMLTKCKCNNNLANHPKIPIGRSCDGKNFFNYIRVIGLLNGILEELGEPKIAQIEDKDNVINFMILNKN